MNDDRVIIPADLVVDEDGDVNEQLALAQLLVDEAVFFNALSRESIAVTILASCNDVFGWAMADCEPVSTAELPDLYRAHMADPRWGVAKWCVRKRGEMPQAPVLRDMKGTGLWDLDEATLRPNRHDEASRKAHEERAAAGGRGR